MTTSFPFWAGTLSDAGIGRPANPTEQLRLGTVADLHIRRPDAETAKPTVKHQFPGEDFGTDGAGGGAKKVSLREGFWDLEPPVGFEPTTC